MQIEIQITREPIDDAAIQQFNGSTQTGAWLEFRGVVRDEENGAKISALEYEAYSPMAENEMCRILEMLGNKFPCLTAKVIHRVGKISVGETAIYVGLAAKHRGEAISLLAEFMDRLKQDVPIWKARALRAEVRNQKPEAKILCAKVTAKNLDEAVSEISSRCETLSAVRVPLKECFNRILREDIFAADDSPPCDKSTRDGFAILQDDDSEIFQVVDSIFAADWKPRQLKIGEAVRVATGASLPCENLRVVMQENVERTRDKIRIVKHENNLNVRKRGEEMKAGEKLLNAGTRMNAGVLSLLASAGCGQPLAGARLKVLHFTTGDELISPEKIPQPGQIRDSNSILIRALLQNFSCDLFQQHLPENFELARKMTLDFGFETLDLLLVSGGASVGEKDFTQQILESLGFEIIFNRVNLRPGAPLIFGVNGKQIAFGLPGNPLSHFVCFHLFVAAALAKLLGEEPKKFLPGKLAEKLEDAPCPRETLWPARLEFLNGELRLHPLKWSSSGDVTCLAETNALIRVPANRGSIGSGEEVEFLSA